MAKRPWLKNFTAHRLDMLVSPSWMLAPRTLKVVLERLEIEHLRHGGYKNGELFVGYSEFVKHGVSRRSIKRTVQLGVSLGLLEVAEAETRGIGIGAIRPPSAYRLTYLEKMGSRAAPTDEWRSITRERAEALVRAYRAEERKAEKATRKRDEDGEEEAA